ncbi:MAG: hypothetical protein COB58_06945 [Thalassobium sp.]|nr:MAG: hypothetical protein COB58_06945 [Thalassobium sp.]
MGVVDVIWKRFNADRRVMPILLAILGNVLVTILASFLLSFFPLFYRSIHVATTSADEFGNALINNAYDQVERAVSTVVRGFEGIDSAGIQDLYRARLTNGQLLSGASHHNKMLLVESLLLDWQALLIQRSGSSA